MEREISNYFKERPELLKLGEFIVERTYDNIVTAYSEVYNEGYFHKEDNESDVVLERTKSIVAHTILSLLNHLFILHGDYKLILEKYDEDDKLLKSVDITELSDGFTGDMLGKGRWLDLFSKYGNLED
ncbi:MAG: hypothetical protein ATN35_06025 [Epulopiscium sp. Nele67-Bin004]|nr:MAG: hypothetical protein ATN35_06025 [Epulopiscium sp. Nele67-Bin004]